MFRWRITKYEDKGSYWDLAAEEVDMFQFEKDSKNLSRDEVDAIKELIEKFDKDFVIKPFEDIKNETEQKIEELKIEATNWLERNSKFIESNERFDFDSKVGSRNLADDLKRYMKEAGLEEIEAKTTDSLVLNPNSGEWIKGMSIVLAELGLVSYYGKVPRTKDIFEGIGSKANREKYLLRRLAFIRAIFQLMNYDEVIIYRGMSSEHKLQKVNRTYLSCTFSLDVANDFSELSRDSKFKNSYILKMSCLIEKIFMTYLETEAMNKQYCEAEAIVFYDESISI